MTAPEELGGAPESGVAGPAAVPVAPRRPGRELGATGSATRSLLMLAGAALLLGALAIAFGESNPAASSSRPRRRIRRSTIRGWEDNIPLAPGKRERARRRAGIRSAGAPEA